MGLCVQMVLTVLTLSVGFKGGEVVPSFYIGATFGCVVGPLLGLPAGFSAAVGLVCVFCGATNTLVASIVLAAELFSGAGFELMALACGLSYMFSGYHSLYSSQGFRTSKLFRNSCSRRKKNEEKISWLRLLIFSAGRATISVVSSCKSDDADKLSSRLHDAERAAPQGRCKQPVMCRSSTTAERRGEPLPGAPVTAQRVARRGVQFGWNRGTFLIFQALHPVSKCAG